jgi:5,10-methylenetetrahydromethanopterin reductase
MMADPWGASTADVLDEAVFAGSIGADTYWLAQIWRMDSMTLIPTLAAQTGSQLKFGTAIVASYLRHPVTLASQALTANLLVDGRLTLGVGLSHKPVIEGMFEIPFDRPIRDISEYLDVLVPALEQKPIDAHGASVSFHGVMDVPEAPAPELLLAALGPQMLRLCGARTAGTITFMAGPSTLSDFVIPTVHRAAEHAGRAAPRVVVLVGMWITDDPAAARAQAADRLAIYGTAPSYRALLDREGLVGPEECTIIGSEDAAREELARYDLEGVTEIGIQILADGQDRDRTRQFIASLCRDQLGA